MILQIVFIFDLDVISFWLYNRQRVSACLGFHPFPFEGAVVE